MRYFIPILLIAPLLWAANTSQRSLTVTANDQETEYTSEPSLPMAHNSDSTPVEIYVKNRNGARVGACEFDDTDITDCEFPSPIDGSNKISIVIKAAANGAKFEEHSATKSGAIPNTASTIHGLKTFNDGFIGDQVGVTDGSSAAPGDVGEVIELVKSSSQSLTSSVEADVLSTTLPAGTWFIFATLGYTGTATTMTRSISYIRVDSTDLTQVEMRNAPANVANVTVPSMYGFFNSTGSSTLKLVTFANFSGGTCSIHQNASTKPTKITAVRIR